MAELNFTVLHVKCVATYGLVKTR